MESSKKTAQLMMKCYSPDIIHETYYTKEQFKTKHSKRVLTVYDFIHERYPEMFTLGHLTVEAKKSAILRSDHIICISENTRQDLLNFYNVDKDKTSVIHLGADDIFDNTEPCSSTKKIHPKKPYLLYVGSRGAYKNFKGFLKAYAASSKVSTEYDIVCFGGGHFTSEEYSFANHLGISPPALIHYGGSDKILAQLYKEATAFVYPSLYEGFGIPPIEAMASYCPVISSNTSSLPEVIGDAAEYFDPNDTDSIVGALDRVLTSTSRRQELITLGKERQKNFSWKKCADETLAVYRGLL